MKRVSILAAASVLAVAGSTAAVARAAETPAAAAPATTEAAGASGTTENLDRGLISMRTTAGNFLSWRLLRSDPAGAAFDVYRGATRITTTGTTNFTDRGAPAGASYTVRPAGSSTLAAVAPTATLAASSMDV